MTITITMPDDVIYEIGQVAEEQNRTRSNMIATAVKEWLALKELKERHEESRNDK